MSTEMFSIFENNGLQVAKRLGRQYQTKLEIIPTNPYRLEGKGQDMVREWYSDVLVLVLLKELMNDVPFTSFIEFKQFLHSYHYVDNTTGIFRCSCAMGMKKYKCKHSVGIQILFHNLAVDLRAIRLRLLVKNVNADAHLIFQML